jgi:serine protease Do
MLASVMLAMHIVASQPSLAPEVPRMTAPVVHVRSVRSPRLSSLAWVNHLLPQHSFNAVGSGFIVDERGLILTNEHVVEGADRVVVTIDDHDVPAEVVGRDHELDVALLSVHTSHVLKVARLGRSANVRVGDFVVAVGNPFGLDHTVTSGIVSARLRMIADATKVPLLQTDASINPGSSGGPLYDLSGRVIGINTAIVPGANGIGFAVPIDFIRSALPQLRASGKIHRGFIGARLDSITPELATVLRLRAHRGVLVAAVTPGGPAEQAGLRPGDVIVRWDGQMIDSSDVLPWAIALSPPGSRVRVRVVREGAPLSLRVMMGVQP